MDNIRGYRSASQTDKYFKLSTLSLYITSSLLNAGGILGLFTGMSILSIVEIVFWFLRSLVNGFSHKINKNRF